MSESVGPTELSLENSFVASAAPLAANVPADSALAPARETEDLARPVTQRERIPTIDVVRGFALLGILLMNISVFSGPIEISLNPLIVGHHNTANIAAWALRWVFFEGKMRAAFSMLFGAGVILLTERAERRGNRNVADIFLRRNMWLVLFGLLHFYFIWFGDILYYYGLTALLFLYPCRHVRARNLLIAGAAVLLLGIGTDSYFARDARNLRNQGLAAQALQQAGRRLTTEQQVALQNWQSQQEHRKKMHDDDLKANRGSYWEQFKWRVDSGPEWQATYYYEFGFTDTLEMMLLGMGLYRLGFLTGALSYRAYGWIIAVGLPVSVAINGMEAWGLIHAGFQRDYDWWWIFYQLGRTFGGIANVAVVVVVCKAGALKWLTRPLAAVGQTALSNYLLTSVLCSLLFNGFGLGFYGKLEYYQLYVVVLCVWVINLTVSPLWLRHFQFGPMEWVWRSLTYWRKQPMRTRATQSGEAVAVPA